MHNPMHPADVIRESYLVPMGISVTDAAKCLGVTRKTFSELVNKKSSVSVKMAYRLSIACNTTPKFWLNLQAKYDLWLSKDLDLNGVKPFSDFQSIQNIN